jgi:YQGE family putative transporter
VKLSAKLNREAWVLLSISGLHAFSFALSNVFVNVFLWKIKHDLLVIAWYNVAEHFATALTFIIAGWITKRVDRVVSIRIGVALQALFYLTVLMLGTKAIDYAFILGLFLGVGSGFYWLSFNVLYFEISERDNRDAMNGASGFISSLAGMIAPITSGFLITHVDDLLGYRIIFSISLAIFALAVFVSFRLHLRRATGRFQLFPVLASSFNPHDDWFWIQWGTFFQGLREGIFLFLTGLLVYFVSNNELVLGSYLTLTSIVSLISYFILGKYLRPEWRMRAMLLACVMMGLLLLPFLYYWNTTTMMLYGAGLYLFYPYYYTATLSTAYDMIGGHPSEVERRVEHVVAKELMLNSGRLVSLFIFIAAYVQVPTLLTIKVLLFIFGFVQIVAWALLRKIRT